MQATIKQPLSVLSCTIQFLMCLCCAGSPCSCCQPCRRNIVFGPSEWSTEGQENEETETATGPTCK